MTVREREAFDSLTSDSARERFAWAFWRDRGEEALARNRENERAAIALRSLAPEREQLVRIAGKPTEIESVASCARELRPLEVWTWSPAEVARQIKGSKKDSFTAVFVQTSTLDLRTFELWTKADPLTELTFGQLPPESLSDLMDRLAYHRCLNPQERQRLLRSLTSAVSIDEVVSRVPWPSSDDTWLETFTTQADPLVGRVSVKYPGSFASRYTILEANVELPVTALATTAGGQLFDRITLVGDVFRSGRLVDTFEIVHLIAGAPPPRETVTLAAHRNLRPGTYELELRAHGTSGLALLRASRPLEVPVLENEAPPPAGRRQGFSGLTRDEVVLLTTFPSIELLEPGGKIVTGSVDVEAITTGGPISSVAFFHGDELLAKDNDPPWQLGLTLDDTEITVVAAALDVEGRELARDSLVMRRAAKPFAVRIEPNEEPTATIEVAVPEGQRLKNVICYHDDAVLKSFLQPSTNTFTCPRPSVAGGRLSFLRAAATLDHGEQAEALLFLTAQRPQAVDVGLVELFVSVLDRNGRPVPDLTKGDFAVREEGRQREIERFGSLQDLPLNVAVLMDTSSSMGRRLRVSAASAQSFFESVLTEGDLAALASFHHDIRVLVPFTDSIEDLRYGASGLRAWGSTRLWDGIGYALHLFDGLENRRALVVLTDGADVGSDYATPQLLDALIRAGVALYPISLGSVDQNTKAGLAHLANETGGRHFSASSMAELDRIYHRIEEILRSQYLVAYRSDGQVSGSFEYREVDVEILRPGLRASSIDGYFTSR